MTTKPQTTSKKCDGCKTRIPGFNKDKSAFFDYCFDCKCKAWGCNKRAVHEISHLCSSHHKEVQLNVQDNELRVCSYCQTRPCVGKFIFCSKDCAAKVPNCQVDGCSFKCIGNGAYFSFCQRHKCYEYDCENVREADSIWCTSCSNKQRPTYVKNCVRCGVLNDGTSTFLDALCPKCQVAYVVRPFAIHETCFNKGCSKQAEYEEQKDGTRKYRTYCLKCVCKHRDVNGKRDCFQCKATDYMCKTHASN